MGTASLSKARQFEMCAVFEAHVYVDQCVFVYKLFETVCLEAFYKRLSSNGK